jgi:hypothetical protein
MFIGDSLLEAPKSNQRITSSQAQISKIDKLKQSSQQEIIASQENVLDIFKNQDMLFSQTQQESDKNSKEEQLEKDQNV